MAYGTQPFIPSNGHRSEISMSLWNVDPINLTISRIALGLLGLIATSFEVEGLISARQVDGVTVRSLPEVVYFIAHGTLLLSIMGLGISVACCSSTENKIMSNTEIRNRIMPRILLVRATDVNTRGLADLIHELCEIDIEGRKQNCNPDRMKTIIENLRQNGNLDILNTIPEYFLENADSEGVYGAGQPLYTPLQYWAAKGDLATVQILVRAGAVDHCYPTDEISGKITSALYVAAIKGHVKIVEFLLKEGAQAESPFNEIILFSFIPNFVFDICRTQRVNTETLACLELILSNLKQHDPQNLNQQLKIPVDKKERMGGENCMSYLFNQRPQNYQEALNLLQKFGGTATDVFSLEDLRSAGWKVGTGYTLGEIASLK